MIVRNINNCSIVYGFVDFPIFSQVGGANGCLESFAGIILPCERSARLVLSMSRGGSHSCTARDPLHKLYIESMIIIQHIQ